MTRVSVVTVCRNAASELEQTAASVVCQTGVELEYVIVDGASSDRTLDVIASVQKDCDLNHVILKWKSEPDKGIYDAMNKGIAMATGEWILFLNAGDTYTGADVLANMLQRAEQDTQVLYGRVIHIWTFGELEMNPAPLDILRRKMPFCHQSMMARTSLFREHPYDTRYRLAGDYEWARWAYFSGKKFQYADMLVARFESDGGASSQNRLRMTREFASICGRRNTWKWRFEYLGKALEVGFNKVVRSLLPKSINDKMRRRNYERRGGHKK